MDVYLMVFFCDPGRHTLAVVAAVRTAGTVSTTTLHQEAAGPENGICPLQLLTQGYGEVAWSAAVQLDVLSQLIEIISSLKMPHKTQSELVHVHVQQPFSKIGLCNRP